MFDLKMGRNCRYNWTVVKNFHVNIGLYSLHIVVDGVRMTNL